MSLHFAIVGAQAAQAAAKEAEEDLKCGLPTRAKERLQQARREIISALDEVRQHQRDQKSLEKREREELLKDINKPN